jgi:hypothetical protein
MNGYTVEPLPAGKYKATDSKGRQHNASQRKPRKNKAINSNTTQRKARESRWLPILKTT